MDQIGATEARTYLPRLLDRVGRGKNLTITPYGKPVARLLPVTGDRERAQEAAAHIIERCKHLTRVPLADLMATCHDGQHHRPVAAVGLLVHYAVPSKTAERLGGHLRCNELAAGVTESDKQHLRIISRTTFSNSS